MTKNSNSNVVSSKIDRAKLMSKGPGHFKFNSFFAGIGGFDLGFELAGISPAYHCEINDFCNSVLQRHWPDVPRDKDINLVNGSDLPDAEVWCGGFPCQDVSVARGWAGRDGLKGKNSGLFYPFLELIKKKLPEVVVLENVTGLLNSHRGKDFQIIISSLTAIGYGVAWRVMNARYFGAPQSRPRVFICAWKNNVSLALNALYEKENNSSLKNVRKGFLTPSKCKLSGVVVPHVSYCLAATSGRHTGTDWSRTYVAYSDRVRRLVPSECEALQGFPKGWTLPENDFHLNDDNIDALRYHAVGNAVCVPVVQWIAKRIVCGLSGKFNDFIIHSNKKAHAYQMISDYFSDFKGSVVTDNSNVSSGSDDKIFWKNGGAAYAGWCIEGKASPAPEKPKEKKLIDVIDRAEVDEKYFLSPNAATGILRRVQNQGRTLFYPLHEALVRLAAKNKKNGSSNILIKETETVQV